MKFLSITSLVLTVGAIISQEYIIAVLVFITFTFF